MPASRACAASGSAPGVAQGAPLAQQVPAAVELDLDRAQALAVALERVVVGRVGLLLVAQLVLLGDEAARSGLRCSRRSCPDAYARCLVAVTSLLLALALPAAAPAQGPALLAGAGRADITPPTGYSMLGWARGDARALGQHTRLFARAIVLERGGRTARARRRWTSTWSPGGLVVQAARRAGFDPRDVIVSASHTHAGPDRLLELPLQGPRLRRRRPRRSSARRPSPTRCSTRSWCARLALALGGRAPTSAPRRPAGAHDADRRDREPLASRRTSPTTASSCARGERPRRRRTRTARRTRSTRTSTSCASTGVAAGRRVPLGAWSTFANHGTVNRSTLQLLQRRPPRRRRARLRGGACAGAGRVPRRRPVVNVYGNSDAGDVSAGLHALRARRSPSGSAAREARGHARRLAPRPGAALTRRPRLESRWTRVCFCGQATPAGRLADHAVFGTSYLTGSEEGRGPLFDATGDIYEGRRLTAPDRRAGRQGQRAQRRRPHARADRGAAHGGAARRPRDRDHPRRGRPPSSGGARARPCWRPRGRRGVRRVVLAGLRQRVRLLLHDARGVRAPSTTRAARPSTARPAARS